jgi:hypothetical protein
MNTSKRWIALAVAATAFAALSASPLVQAAGNLILPRGSVGTTQLKAGAVTGLKVKDGTLAAADFKAGQLPAGAEGPKGDKGDKGDAGPSGMSGYQLVEGKVANIVGGGTFFDELTCPSGKKAMSAGFIGGADGMATIFSYATNGGAAWYIRVKNLGAATASFRATAICVNVS